MFLRLAVLLGRHKCGRTNYTLALDKFILHEHLPELYKVLHNDRYIKYHVPNC